MSNGERNLAKVPIHLIEAALADALSELTGQRFTAAVRQLDLQPTLNAALSDEYDILIRVRLDSADRLAESEVVAGSSTPQAGGLDELGGEANDDVPSELTLTGLTGRQLNHEWEVGARHALYHHHGRWYHQLSRFPGALFDYNGYVVFRTEEDFRKSPHVNITKDVHVPRGIASIPGYVRRR
jgi:5-methylcytosine-specific restriction protein A